MNAAAHDADAQAHIQALRQALRDLGWIEGQTICR
jgi:hypothetical protein